MLNTKHKAAFHHGDSVVPVVAGTLVTFTSSMPRSMAGGSTVQLAGPFHLKTFEYVGCASCEDECTSNIIEACGEGRCSNSNGDVCRCDHDLKCKKDDQVSEEVDRCMTALLNAQKTNGRKLLFYETTNRGVAKFRVRNKNKQDLFEDRGYQVIDGCVVVSNDFPAGE